MSGIKNGLTPNNGEVVTARARFAGAIWTLVVLAPFIAEVLSGSTRTSILFVLIPEMMVWGVGALLCRELVRRWRGGSVSLLLMGLALSVAEEFIIQQTSIAPLPFPMSHAEYGRMWGVNLIYLLFMLGFESVWVVVAPVQLTELFFPGAGDRPWLRKRGVLVSCVVFLLGCRIAWYGWTQQARPRMGGAPYHPPAGLLALGVAAIVALMAAAYLAREAGRQHGGIERGTAPAWLAGLAAFVLGAAWFEVIGQVFVAKPVQPFWIVLIAGAAWAALAFSLFTWWSSRAAWNELHRFAAVSGVTLGCMVAPYLSITSWPKVDVVGLIVYDVVALAGFFILGTKVLRRARQAG